jgi:uncharacterized protein YndB with AHSA1/START domain
MSTMADERQRTTTQVHRVYIKATPQQIWDAITDPEWNGRYGYGGRGEFDLRPGGKYLGFASEAMKEGGRQMGIHVPDLAVDGEVIEVDPPRRLVQTFRMLMDAQLEAEGFTRLTYEIEEAIHGTTKLTVVHELEGAPTLALLLSGDMEGQGAGGGWPWTLSTLKTLLETGDAPTHI